MVPRTRRNPIIGIRTMFGYGYHVLPVAVARRTTSSKQANKTDWLILHQQNTRAHYVHVEPLDKTEVASQPASQPAKRARQTDDKRREEKDAQEEKNSAQHDKWQHATNDQQLVAAL